MDLDTDAVVILRVRRHVEDSEVWIAPELTDEQREQLPATMPAALIWLGRHWQEKVVDE